MRASEKQLLEAIQAGHDTTPKLIKHLKRSNHWICKHAKYLQDLGLIYIEKTISRPNIYKEVSTYAIPAHDPFNLCGLRRALREAKATESSVLPSTASGQLGERRRHRLDDAENNSRIGDSYLGVTCNEYGKPRELRDIL